MSSGGFFQFWKLKQLETHVFGDAVDSCHSLPSTLLKGYLVPQRLVVFPLNASPEHCPVRFCPARLSGAVADPWGCAGVCGWREETIHQHHLCCGVTTRCGPDSSEISPALEVIHHHFTVAEPHQNNGQISLVSAT